MTNVESGVKLSDEPRRQREMRVRFAALFIAPHFSFVIFPSMAREIHLDGTEVTLIKAIGFGGTVTGDALIERAPHLAEAEMIDTLKSLLMLGYIEVDREGLHSMKDVENATFHVNPGYSRDLREALDPSAQKKSRRIRRE